MLNAFVTSAALSDQQGLFGILDRAGKDFPRLSKLWTDCGYQGAYPKSYCQDYGIDLEIAKRSDRNSGFKVVARRWVVERTLPGLEESGGWPKLRVSPDDF